MTTLDGGVNSADLENKAGNDTNDKPNNQEGGQTDLQAQFDELRAQLDTLKRESSGKDTKISQLLKEKETQTIASKTAEEQLEYYRNQTAQFERREAFRTSFKEVGLNPDDFISIIDEKDPAIQAGKFAALLKARADESAKTALEKFKADELAKIGGKEPKPTNNSISDTNPNKSINNAIRGAVGYQVE